MQKNINYKLSSFAVAFGIIVNFCAIAISNIIGGNPALYTLAGYMPLIISCIISDAKINPNGKIVFFILFFSVVILILSLVFRNGDPLLFLKSIMYFILFSLVFLFFKGGVNSLVITFLFLGFIFQLNIIFNLTEILNSGLNLYNIRALTIVDKSFISFAFSISVAISLTFLIYRGLNLFHLLNVISILVLNIFFIQGKVLFAIILIPLIIVFFSFKGKKYKRVKYSIIFSLFTLFLVFTLKPELIPDFIKNLINVTTSSKIYVIEDSGVQDITYIQRSKLFKQCLSIIEEYPILGYGAGNFSSLNNSDLELAHEAESTYLGIAVDYGLIFFILHGILLIYLLKLLIKKYRKFKDINNLISLVLLLTTILCCIFNDYFSFFYWIILAVLFSTINYNLNLNTKTYKKLQL